MLNDDNTGGGLSEAAAERTSTIPDRPIDTEVISSPDTSFSEGEERIQRPRRVLKESFVKGSGGGREEGAANDESRCFSPLRVSDSHIRGGVSLDPPPFMCPSPRPLPFSRSSSSSSMTPIQLRVPLGDLLRGTVDVGLARRLHCRRFKFLPGEMIRLGGICWRKLGPEARGSWNQRAASLNNMTPAGVFAEVPVGLIDFESSALRSLSAELTDLSRMLRSSLKRAPSKGSGILVRTFGPEKIYSGLSRFALAQCPFFCKI